MAHTLGEASSSTAPPHSWTHHVFLSFRGEDTRKGFTNHLYAALTTKGIKAFRDDKDLKRGEVISIELLKAIEESMFAIIVLSPNYASSTWCLDELQKIVECSNNMGLYIVPVFYGVEPSDVRHQKGCFDDAFKKHKDRFGRRSKEVKGWRDALTQVSNCLGWDSKDWNDEAELVENIAQHIYTRLISKLPSCDNLVGIASRMQKVIRLIDIGSNDVRFVGIWGMGGIGKTTIARAVYDAIQGEFKVSCFLANVREGCETKGLIQIQKELVAHININISTFNNKYDGKKIIRSSFCNKKALLVLDDINEASQLENLVDKQDWFGAGSRIIITTRDMHLLKVHGVHEIYEVEELAPKEALHLFSSKAFRRDEPKEQYLVLSKEVVKYSGGLPLALEVLGSYLHGRTIDVWHSAIKKIKNVSHSKILDTLKVSYEGLDSMEKNIFLDVACFFKGMDKDYVTSILESCGHNPQIAIEVLIERSLITLSQEGNVLEMHDLLQEMGKIIVIQESPDDPGKRSRLWSLEDIDFVLTNNKGTEAIQSLALTTRNANQGGKVLRSDGILTNFYEADWNIKAFLKTSQLKFLGIHGVHLHLGLDYLPSSLKVLHWKGCSLKTLPFGDQHNEIVEIRLRESKIEQLWHGEKLFKKLKYLDLKDSKIKQIPDLSTVPFLETLVLYRCSCLTEVHPSLVSHKNLVLLDLCHCESLKTLPGKLKMGSLKKLLLDDCWRLETLPEFGKCMKHLSRLSLVRTAISKLPASVGCLVGLKYLSLMGCRKLVCLPDSIHALKSLRTLDASQCESLCGLPPLGECCATDWRLPSSISGLPLFSSLDSSYLRLPPQEEHCNIELRSPSSISSLPLSYLDLSYCCLTEQAFPFYSCHFPSLTYLDLSCNLFVRVPISIHQLPKLQILRLNGCQGLQLLPELPSSIRELEACSCHSLKTFHLNPLSKVCSVFASPSQDHDEILHMLISGRKIPSWFVHQEDGNSVSVPIPNDGPLNERLGIILCFQLHISGSYCIRPEWSLAVRNGRRLIPKTVLSRVKPGFILYILCLTDEFFCDGLPHDNLFELLIEDSPYTYYKILSSAARWVHIEDIEDLNMNEQMEQMCRYLELI